MAQLPRHCPHCRVPLVKASSQVPGFSCTECGKTFSVQPRKAAAGAPQKEVPTALPFAPPPPGDARFGRLPLWALGLAAGIVAFALLIPAVLFLTSSTRNKPLAEQAKIDEPAWDRKKDALDIVPKPSSRFADPEQKPQDKTPLDVEPEEQEAKEPPSRVGNADPTETPKPQPMADPVEPEPQPDTGRRVTAILTDGLLPLEKFDGAVGGLIDPLQKSDLKYTVSNFLMGDKIGRGLRIAVNPGTYDDIGSLLDKLGDGYKYTLVSDPELRELSNMTPYDVIFLNCGGGNSHDLRLVANLRQYVEQGGTLYASDLRFGQLAKAFPDYTINVSGIRSFRGNVRGKVVDPGLRRILGQQVMLHFDLEGRPAAFNPKKTKIYLNTQQASGLWVPMLTKFKCGEGHVIFTSFHNSKQLSSLQQKLLMYIVFSTINSEVEAKTRDALADFDPSEVKNLNISQGLSLTRQTVRHQHPGPLRFALGFREQDTKMRLDIHTPDGKIIEHTDSSSFILEINDAPQGNWQYSVTALQTAYDNFPFTLMIGGKKAKN